MSPLSRSLIAGLLGAILTAGSLYWFQRQRATEAAGLRSANDRLRFEASRRHHATRLAAAAPSADSAAQPVAAQSHLVAPAAAAPQENYRNEGRATPIACLQTFAWACDRGDATLVGGLLHFDPPAREKAEAYFATLPESARGSWKSLDEMAAVLLTADVMEHPFPSADILASATAETIATDRVKLRLPDTPKDRLEFQRTPNGWSYVMRESVVDEYLAHNSAPSAMPVP